MGVAPSSPACFWYGMVRSRLLATLLAAAALAGCGSPSVSDLSGAGVADAAPGARLTALTDMDQRVARVAWRLMSANVGLCPVVRQSAGWAIHSANQYSLEMRPIAEQRFALNGDLPGILSAPEGSPAAVAGLRTGDLILAVNGVALERGVEGRRPQYEGLAANLRQLDAALAGGTTQLTILRAGQSQSLSILPVRACGYEVQLNPSDDLGARADGRRLFINTALADFARTDDELALILGHELAHNVLGHRSWSETGGEGRTVVDRDCAPQLCADGDKERQADRVGLYLMARAGYRPETGTAFWERYADFNWQVRFPSFSHASAGTRARRLAVVQQEIEARQAAGQPLDP